MATLQINQGSNIRFYTIYSGSRCPLCNQVIAGEDQLQPNYSLRDAIQLYQQQKEKKQKQQQKKKEEGGEGGEGREDNEDGIVKKMKEASMEEKGKEKDNTNNNNNNSNNYNNNNSPPITQRKDGVYVKELSAHYILSGGKSYFPSELLLLLQSLI